MTSSRIMATLRWRRIKNLFKKKHQKKVLFRAAIFFSPFPIRFPLTTQLRLGAPSRFPGDSTVAICSFIRWFISVFFSRYGGLEPSSDSSLGVFFFWGLGNKKKKFPNFLFSLDTLLGHFEFIFEKKVLWSDFAAEIDPDWLGDRFPNIGLQKFHSSIKFLIWSSTTN